MKQKIIKAGLHSHAVIVPATFIHALGIKKGDMVEVKTNRVTGIVTLKFQGAVQLPLPASSGNRLLSSKKSGKKKT